MNILDKIIAHKTTEVNQRKLNTPVAELEKSEFFARDSYSLVKSLQQPNTFGIIAEIKRKSPSQGVIHNGVSVERISTGYAAAGVSGLSILTDYEFFGGKDEDLIQGRRLNEIPILRKDFIIDEYQIVESKAIGADVILLIAAALTPDQIKQFVATAHSLHLEVLLEVHDEAELMNNLNSGAEMIGVNNRNLKTFEVSVDTSRRLIEKIPDEHLKIAESGIDSVGVVTELRSLGFDGFLMGQNFMKHAEPEVACKRFIDELRQAHVK
jgi:indole-3-glycerol phosphate synthase